jgi:hypothetical protein
VRGWAGRRHPFHGTHPRDLPIDVLSCAGRYTGSRPMPFP